MRVLVVGSGGREHALAWKVGQSPKVSEVFLAPGNSGSLLEPKGRPTNLAADDYRGIERFCREKLINLVVVGPDQALADGLGDQLRSAGVPVFGPGREAARLEFSKAFAKEMMGKAGIPTARFQVLRSVSEAEKFLSARPWKDGYVVKADGLALGKGVVVCGTAEEALKELRDFLEGGKMGDAGQTVVLEERLHGPEVSVFHLCDGEEFRLLGFSCDYKRLLDGGNGPNTGGMGTYSPADWVPPGLRRTVDQEVVKPLLAEMKRRGTPYSGVLFTGLMVTGDGPKVLEFNARFGDPETQALLPMLSGDLVPWLEAVAGGKLSLMPAEVPMRDGAAVHVVMAAHGYPGDRAPVRKGDSIRVPEDLLQPHERGKLFFAGVSGEPGSFKTNGGRVIGYTAWADSRAEAREAAYAAARRVEFSGKQMRSDVGE